MVSVIRSLISDRITVKAMDGAGSGDGKVEGLGFSHTISIAGGANSGGFSNVPAGWITKWPPAGWIPE